MQAKILIIDDEEPIRALLRLALKRSEFLVIEAVDAASARTVLATDAPNLILLDWMLPDTSGIDFAKELRGNSHTQKTPIIMLTARAFEDDKIRGLQAGVDDYVTKPFSPRELVARIQAVLRRSNPNDRDPLSLSARELTLETQSHRVMVAGSPIKLGPTEYRLLHHFMSHPERVFSRGQLLDNIWGIHVYVEERTVDVHIRRLRKALEPSNHHTLIQTVRSEGYRFSVKG